MSNLLRHAEDEMRRAGLYSKDADYDGMIPEAVMKMVKCLADEGHSGGSHALVMEIFNRVARFKTLGPLTSDPTEWMSVSEYYGPDSPPTWQSRRQSSCFSLDGGKTYYDLDDKPLRFRKIRRFLGLPIFRFRPSAPLPAPSVRGAAPVAAPPDAGKA